MAASKLAKLYRSLIRIGKISGAVTLIIAPPFAWWEYNRSTCAAKKETTFTIWKEYNKNDLRKAILDMNYAFVKESKDIFSSEASAVNGKLLNVVVKNKLDLNVFLVSNFFSSVHNCLEGGLCDAYTAQQLFKKDARFLRQYIYPAIQAQKPFPKSTYGDGLTYVATLNASQCWY